MQLAVRVWVVGFLLLPGFAGAEVIYDTYPFGSSSGSDRLVGGENDTQYADPFVVPAGELRELEQITLRLRTRLLAGTETDMVVRLREDAGGEPGAVLEDWIVPGGNTTPSDYVLPSSTFPELAAGATYWINVGNSDTSGAASWLTAETNSLDWLFASSPNLFPPWQSPGGGSLITGHGFARVEVPEPASAGLLVLAGLLFAPLVRLRSRLVD